VYAPKFSVRIVPISDEEGARGIAAFPSGQVVGLGKKNIEQIIEQRNSDICLLVNCEVKVLPNWVDLF